MFRLPGFKIGSPSKGESALSSVKTKSMSELSELLRNKHSKGQDAEEEEVEKKPGLQQDEDEDEDNKVHGDGLEIVEEIDIFANAKNRFEEVFGEIQEAIDHELQLRADEAAGKDVVREGPKVATTGRIQFDDIIIEEEIPPLELCDNCETRYSVAYCNGCKELLCMRCVELCHPIPPRENKHPHEHETVLHPPLLRQIEEGDKSSVVIEEEFPVPATYIEEQELAEIKQMDITKPNSLATNYRDDAANVVPLSKPYSSLPRFKVDDKLLFMDPVSRQQAYGRVISEWDHRHGAVAPPIVRGEGSMYMYVVEKIGLVSQVGSLRELLKHIADKADKPEYPKFRDGDTGNIPYRQEFEMARELNRKMQDLHEVKTFGPRRHFKESEEERHAREKEKRKRELEEIAKNKAEFMAMQGGADVDIEAEAETSLDLAGAGSVGGRDDLSVGSLTMDGGMGEGDALSLSPGRSPKSVSLKRNASGGAIGQSARLLSLTADQEKRLQEEHAQMEREAKKAAAEAEEKKGNLLAGFTTELNKDEQLDLLREQLPQFSATPTSPRDASHRSFIHAVLKDNPAYLAMEAANERDKEKKLAQKQSSGLHMGQSRLASTNDLPKKVVDSDRALNVLVLPEHALKDPSEEYDLSQASSEVQNLTRREAVLSKIVRNLVRRLQGYAFTLWVDQMHHLLAVKQEFVAQKIQSVARRWLARGRLQEARELYWAQCERKRLALHANFQYCPRQTPYCVTMDHKLFFRTKLGANRYSTVLRAKCLRVFSLVKRKAAAITLFWFTIWRNNATGIDETVLKYGHFDMKAYDIDDELEPSATGDVGEKGEHFHPGKDPREVVKQRIDRQKQQLLREAAEKAAEQERKRLARLRHLAGKGKGKGKGKDKHGSAGGGGSPGGGSSDDDASLGDWSHYNEGSAFGAEHEEDEHSWGGHHIDLAKAQAEGDGFLSLAESGQEGFAASVGTVSLATDSASKLGGGSVVLDDGGKASLDTWLSHPHPTPGSSVSTATQNAAFELYANFRKKGPRQAGIATDDDTYVNVSTMQLGMVRTPAVPPTKAEEEERKRKIREKKNMKGYFDKEDEDEGKFDPDGELPPYMPSLDVQLPAAIPVWMPTTAEERLHVTSQRRLTYCSYKAHMEGPCDDACWVIPGRLAMGPIPWGKASKRTQTSSITAILLGGCDVFVSLMQEEEEIAMERRLDIKPIGSLLKSASSKARMAVDEVVRNSKRVCAEMEKKRALIPIVDKNHANFEANKKEITRAKARSKLANEAAVRAKSEFERLPKRFDWIRIPMATDTCPTIHELLPVCWHLERLLSEKRSIYLYSGEGHGRVGMLAGCLLGRLYAFNPQETLIRIQNCHDCAKREEGRKVPVSCPQLKKHRDLIVQVVSHSNKASQGIVKRSHTDPETHQDVLHIPKKGTGSGLSYTSQDKALVQPLSVAHSNVHSTEMDVSAMTRKKESVRYDVQVARDVVPSWESEHGRGEDKVPINELYEVESKPERIKQMVDIIRETELGRTDPQGLGPDHKTVDMPSLRVKREGL